MEIPLQDLHRAVLFDFLPPNPRNSPEINRLWHCTPAWPLCCACQAPSHTLPWRGGAPAQLPMDPPAGQVYCRCPMLSSHWEFHLGSHCRATFSIFRGKWCWEPMYSIYSATDFRSSTIFNRETTLARLPLLMMHLPLFSSGKSINALITLNPWPVHRQISRLVPGLVSLA